MNMIQLIACAGLITGFFILLRVSPMEFTEGVFRRITSKPRSIRAEVNESTRRKKKSFLRREICLLYTSVPSQIALFDWNGGETIGGTDHRAGEAPAGGSVD